MVIPGHNLGNSQVSVNRTIGPTLVSFVVQNLGFKDELLLNMSIFVGTPPFLRIVLLVAMETMQIHITQSVNVNDNIFILL